MKRSVTVFRSPPPFGDTQARTAVMTTDTGRTRFAIGAGVTAVGNGIAFMRNTGTAERQIKRAADSPWGHNHIGCRPLLWPLPRQPETSPREIRAVRPKFQINPVISILRKYRVMFQLFQFQIERTSEPALIPIEVTAQPAAGSPGHIDHKPRAHLGSRGSRVFPQIQASADCCFHRSG